MNIKTNNRNLVLILSLFFTVCLCFKVKGQNTISINYHYDDLERIEHLTTNLKDTINYTYDEVGNILGIEVKALCHCCTVYTNSTDGIGSLRAAVDCATSGDTILFDPIVLGQTIDLTSTIPIDKDLVLKQSNSTIVDIEASFIGPIFTIESGNEVYIESVDMHSGNGANNTRAIHNLGELILNNVNVFDLLGNSGQGSTILNEGELKVLGNSNIKID